MPQIMNNRKGFTIIEVLIVLAIAGLILLIVFLAVPALQRNSRNTQRVNDVSRALGASQEVLNNNKNSMTALDSAALQAAIGTPAYYTSTNITVSTTAPAAAPGGSNASTIDTVVIYKGADCSGGVAVPGTTRELAATFTVETGGGTAQRCTQS